MPDNLRIVHLEDDPNDRELVQAALTDEGIAFDALNVSTREAFVAALESGVDVILSDYALPGFDGLSALEITRGLAPELPFILVSGTMGEEAAIDSLRSGATDYVLKHRLSRLAPAVLRAVQEARERRTRQAAESALERDQQFLRALLDSLETGVVACDQNGLLTFFNRATRELFGLPEEPLPPDQWASRYSLRHADGRTPLEEDQTPLHRALKGEHLRNVEMTILHPHGAARSVLASGQPILDETGRRLGAVVTMQDVTEHRKLERQFRQAQKMEAMGRLAAGVAHDFNNLLTVISGYCDLARRRLQPGLAAGRDLDEIAKAGDRAANLTRQLLAFSRQQVLEPRLLDLNAVVADVQKMLRRLIGADVELAFEPAENLARIQADAGQIEQVLVNLIVNARDAMPEGGRITISTANVEVEELHPRKPPADAADPATWDSTGALRQAHEIPPGRYVAMTVTDSGCGMDTETASRIFEPFFTTKEAGRGTGLGLSTVHGIVAQSGGHITVHSKPGLGTTFTIYLPQIVGVEEEAKPVAAPVAAGRGSGTILVVDDDAALLGLVGEILRLQGYTVVTAAGGEAALRLLQDRGRSIDAMVCDVIMPKMGGRELAQRLGSLRPDLPTVFMSGYVGDDVDTLGSLLSARVGFIQKPFSAEALLAKLREVLDDPAAAAA